jgi:hypothetical protein
MIFLALIYLGGLNLEYIEFISIPFSQVCPTYFAEPATPYVKEVPALNVADIGAVIAPTRPEPSPLKNPLVPSSLVF